MKAHRFSPATVIASIALLVSLSGTAVAAGLVTGASVLDGSLTAVDIRDNTLGTKKIKNGSLLPVDFRELPGGPEGPAGPQGPQGAPGVPGAPGMSGFEVVTKDSAFNNTDVKDAMLWCPDGKLAIAGGAVPTISGYGGQSDGVGLVWSMPTDHQHAWSVRAEEFEPGVASWQLRVFAICANVELEPPETIAPTAGGGLTGGGS